MCENNLENYYKTNFSMAQHHKWSLEELEDMVPYERQIYVELLKEYLEKLKEEREKAGR